MIFNRIDDDHDHDDDSELLLNQKPTQRNGEVVPLDNSRSRVSSNSSKFTISDNSINSNSLCCSALQKILHNKPILRWYIGPITIYIGYSLSCLFYLLFNFIFVLCLWIFEVTSISVSIGLIPLACIGIILLYFTFEIIVFLNKILQINKLINNKFIILFFLK